MNRSCVQRRFKLNMSPGFFRQLSRIGIAGFVQLSQQRPPSHLKWVYRHITIYPTGCLIFELNPMHSPRLAHNSCASIKIFRAYFKKNLLEIIFFGETNLYLHKIRCIWSWCTDMNFSILIEISQCLKVCFSYTV